MRIVMVGAGCVGFASAAYLADFGHEAVCVEGDDNERSPCMLATVGFQALSMGRS